MVILCDTVSSEGEGGGSLMTASVADCRRTVMAALASQLDEVVAGMTDRQAATPKLRFADTAARFAFFLLCAGQEAVGGMHGFYTACTTMTTAIATYSGTMDQPILFVGEGSLVHTRQTPHGLNESSMHLK